MLDPRSGFPFEACGLDAFSEADKDAFIADLTTELELRVGDRLSAGMSDAQLDEFDRLSAGDDGYCRSWLNRNQPGFQQLPWFIDLVAAGHPSPHSEAAPLIWLQHHRPGYREVVAQTWQELVAECVRRFNEED